MRSLLFIGVALLLTISDVYGAIGVVEADKIKESNATPIETVNDGDVPIGCSGITFDGGNYVSPPDVKSAYCDPKNTIYKNRPFVKFFQSDTDGGDKNYLCCIVKNGVCGVSDILVDGDKSKNCNTNNECGDNNFCISDNNPEEVNMAGTFDTTLWKDMPLCCPKRDANQVCAVGDFVGDVTWEDCRKDLGRCWDNKGVCTWKGDKDATKSSCCSPPKKAVCPGEVLPYAVKTHKSNDVDIYDFRLNETLGFNYEDVEQSCIDLKEDSFVYDRKLCCPKYKMIMKGNLSFPVKHLKKDQFADLLLPKKVNLTSEEFKECGPGCKDEEWCAPVEVFNNAKHAKSLQKGSISLCYPKPLCPHPSKQVYPVKRVSGQVPEYSCSVETKECGDKGYCVLIDADAGTNAASFWENNSTLCCPRDQYDNPCSVEVGKRRNPLVDKPGAVLDVPGSNCTDNDNFTREWTPLNDGQGASSHKLCCEWKKPDAATLKKFESETCKSGGKLSITSGLFKKCPDGSADGIDCESSTGKCRPLKNNATVAACCIEDYCPHTGIPMSKTPDCDSDDCIYHRLTLQPLKEKHCKLDSSNKNKCCLPVPNCITESGKEHCGFNKIFPNNTQPQQLNDKCKDTVDCGGFGKYCNVTDKQCYFVPSSTIGKSLEKPCKKSDECKKEGAKFTFHCVMFKKTSEFGECLTFTKLVSTEHKANTGLVIGVIVLVVIGVVFLIAGLIMFLKYRSRNFCDRKKTDKTKAKRGKETTTSNGTTGETTVGETIEGR